MMRGQCCHDHLGFLERFAIFWDMLSLGVSALCLHCNGSNRLIHPFLTQGRSENPFADVRYLLLDEVGSGV